MHASAELQALTPSRRGEHLASLTPSDNNDHVPFTSLDCNSSTHTKSHIFQHSDDNLKLPKFEHILQPQTQLSCGLLTSLSPRTTSQAALAAAAGQYRSARLGCLLIFLFHSQPIFECQASLARPLSTILLPTLGLTHSPILTPWQSRSTLHVSMGTEGRKALLETTLSRIPMKLLPRR